MNNKFLGYLSIPLTLAGHNMQAQQADKLNGSEKTNGKKMNNVSSFR
jgi:hypothetical protein